MIFKSILPTWLLIILFIFIAIAFAFCLVKSTFRTKQNFRLLGILFLGVLMFARPQIPGGNIETRNSDIDIYFAVDATGSMVGKDMKSNKRRLEQAQEDVVAIAKQFPGARYALFAKSAISFQATPLLGDIDALENATKALFYPSTSASTGSGLEDLLSLTADKAIEAKDNDRPKLFFLLSDGEETGGTKSNIPNNFSEAFTSGAIIGYGTSEGTTLGTIRYNYECDSLHEECEDLIIDEENLVDEYKQVDSGYGYSSKRSVDHISKLDQENLEAIAKAAKVKYVTRNDLASLDSLTSGIANNGDIKKSGTKEGYVDCYFILAGAIIILLLWTLSDMTIKLLSERKGTDD